MDVIIVCHTEFGFVFDGNMIFGKDAVSGTKNGVLNLVKIAEKYGAKVSLAVCPEVAEFFPKKINYEIGLHVHPGWQEFTEGAYKYFVGDKYLKEHCTQSVDSTALADYSYSEQAEMISIGKSFLKSEFGVDPKFFVAGRWSLNNDTVKALVNNGFVRDCSAPARPQALGSDWQKLPRICMPYHPDEKDYQEKGSSPLLIIPVSQYFPGGNVNPEVLHRVGLPWLKACFSEYYKQGLPLFHICLHSPSMTDEYFMSGMDKFISFIASHKNINFKFVSEINEYTLARIKADITPYIFSLNKNILKTFLKERVLKIKR